MKRILTLGLLGLCLSVGGEANAGIHDRTESLRPFPAAWRGYLPDHRLIRQVGLEQLNPLLPPPPLRDRYQETVLKLESLRSTRPLDAEELADLGAAYLRLGKPAPALAVLRPAARLHPDMFRIQANLGTAWQLNGEFEQASYALAEAVRLAPPPWKRAEEFHLKLVKLRLAEGKTWRGVDRLFDVNFADVPGNPERDGELPNDAVAIVQQLAWWLPNDGRLLWLLAELAAADGDIRNANLMLEGCVVEFNLNSPQVRQRRLRFKEVVQALDDAKTPTSTRNKFTYRSPRAFQRLIDPDSLPEIQPLGVNHLPWGLLNETELTPLGLPKALPYLRQLHNKTVAIVGYVSPSGTSKSEILSEFLFTENPIGCWFCEVPGPLQSVQVELADGATTTPSRRLNKIVGEFYLNQEDPQSYPYRIQNARVAPVD